MSRAAHTAVVPTLATPGSDAVVLVAQPLSAAAFARHGTVIGGPPPGPGRWINGGTTERFDLVDDLALTAAGGRPTLALFRAQARAFPHGVQDLERHTLGSQTFLPLGRRRFVLVVAPPGPAPLPTDLAAFVTDGHQGVCLAPGTWHHALLAVDAGDFAVIERHAAVVDCDEHRLASAVTVALAWPPATVP